MAHREQSEFIARIRDRFPRHFENCKVLEIGSLNINGTVRDYFQHCTYMGIDLGPGPCVDKVVHACDLPISYNGNFDTIVTCEALEHDRKWRETIDRAYDLLTDNGLLVGTCAGFGRPEHGTSKCNPGCSPFTNDYYGNIYGSSILEMIEDMFDEVLVEVNRHDVYFFGFNKYAVARSQVA